MKLGSRFIITITVNLVLVVTRLFILDLNVVIKYLFIKNYIILNPSEILDHSKSLIQISQSSSTDNIKNQNITIYEQCLSGSKRKIFL